MCLPVLASLSIFFPFFAPDNLSSEPSLWVCICTSVEAYMCVLNTFTMPSFFFFSSCYLILPFPSHPLSLSVPLLLPVRTYCFSAWQSLGLTKGWKAVEGVILWASVARLAANHLYEHTGGQREAHDSTLNSIEEMTEAHPDHINSQWFTDCSDIDPRRR